MFVVNIFHVKMRLITTLDSLIYFFLYVLQGASLNAVATIILLTCSFVFNLSFCKVI